MKKQNVNFQQLVRWPFVVASICVTAIGVFFMTLGARDAEEVLRRNILLQAKMLVESLDQERFLRLTATAADEQSPYYHDLRNTLTRMQAANPTYRYIYLMGQKGSAPPFFYMGTAPEGSNDYSPPGQPYTEEAPSLAHVFATGEATVSDLVTDRWGTWVSALVPLRDRSTGHMLAVFGMDVDAKDWLWSIRLRAILPGVLTLVILVMLMLLYFVLRNRQRLKIQRLLLENNNLLCESEYKTRAILDQSQQFIGMMTVDGILIDVNRRALNFFGIKESDALNKPFLETSWWSHSTKLQERLREAIAEAAAGEFVRFEATHLTVNGDLRIIDFSLSPVKDETGKVLFIIPQGYDITEIKRSEEAVNASEERLSLALDAANDGLWDWDIDSGTTFFSPRYYTMLGYEPGGFEANYAEWHNRVHPEDQARVDAHLVRYLERVEPAFEVEFRLRDKAGGWRWILARGKAVAWNQEGQCTRMVGTHVDITDRKRSEEALRQSEEKFSRLFRLSPDSITLTDVETGKFVDVNDTFVGVFGYSREEVIGSDALTLGLVGKESIKIFYETVARQGHIDNFELDVRSKDGTMAVCSLSSQVVEIEDHRLSLSIIRNITEVKRMQEVMVQTEKMISVGGIAAGIAHEINNPLGIVLQATQNLARRTDPTMPKNIAISRAIGLDINLLALYMRERNLDTYIADIRFAATRAAGIIRHMLDFSRRSESTRSVCALQELVGKALDLAQSDFDLKKNYDFKKIHVEFAISDNLPEINCTESEIEQVLLNILRNAAQAMAGADPPIATPRIDIRLRALPAGVRIEVEDNGPGMPVEVQRRIFEPFFTTKAPGVGTGLGLSVSYFIVTKGHGGSMRVESQPGKGTRFIIELPTEGARL